MNREDIIRMAHDAGFYHIAEADYWHPLFERFAVFVASAEREACIDIVAIHGGSVEIEAAIRARGQA